MGLLILPPALDANVMALWGFISAKAPGGHVALNTLTSDTQLKCYVAHYRHREQVVGACTCCMHRCMHGQGIE